jgi:signal peptide peptidase SppA
MKFPHLAARMFNTPLLIEAGKLATLAAVLGPRIDQHFDWGMIDPAYSRETVRTDTGYRIADGIAIIPVDGTLVHRGDAPNALSGLTGYDRLSQWLSAALKDDAVKGILLDIDSPGGESAGAFDFADEIFAARGQKPIIAVAADTAASAAYLIASAADEVITTRTGRTGSVGVVTAHADMSGAAEKKGIVITHIFAGAHKVDGSPYAPLPDDVRARVQSEINCLYSLFTNTVARNRGMTVDAVKATEALTYMGAAAVDIGFADRVSTREAAFSALLLKTKPSARFFMSSQTMEKPMDEVTTKPAVADAAPEQNNPSPERQAAAAIAASEPSSEQSEPNAAALERARIKSILQSEAATGRSEMAAHLAFETDLSTEVALGLLEKSPKVAAQSPLGLASAMAATPQPNIGSEAPTEFGAPTASSMASTILADFNKAGGSARIKS